MHEIPKGVIKEIQFIPVDHMDEVLLHALIWPKKKKEDDLYMKLSKNTELHEPFSSDRMTH